MSQVMLMMKARKELERGEYVRYSATSIQDVTVLDILRSNSENKKW